MNNRLMPSGQALSLQFRKMLPLHVLNRLSNILAICLLLYPVLRMILSTQYYYWNTGPSLSNLFFCVFFLTVIVSSPLCDMVFFYDKAPNSKPEYVTFQEILDSFAKRVGSWRPFAILFSALLGVQFIEFFMGFWTNSGIAHGLEIVGLLPLAFPLVSAGLVVLWRRFQKFPRSKITMNDLVSDRKNKSVYNMLKLNIHNNLSRFILNDFPTISIFLAFALFISMITSWPFRTGSEIAHWLLASAQDAKINASGAIEQGVVYTVSILLWLILFRTFVPLVSRAAAFYQLFLQKAFYRGRSIALTEAIKDVIAMPSIKMQIRPQHPHLRSLKESLQWIAASYAILFCLVAFCPGELGQCITNWLDCSIVDADRVSASKESSTATAQHASVDTLPADWLSPIQVPVPVQTKPPENKSIWPVAANFTLNSNLNLKLFIASIIATYGTAPFAIMTCAFLPLRRPDEILVNEQGILRPNKIIGPPILFWPDLQKVCLLNTKNPDRSHHVLKMVFKPGGSIKIRLNTISNEHLTQILAMADEFSPHCQFEDAVIKLRQDLLKENQLSLAPANKFESTIFRPHVAGDRINHSNLRIIRKLASKPLSCVYLARDDNANLVVVKQFVLPNNPNNDSVSEKYRAMFKREREIISSLKHPLMAKFIDTFDEDDSSYLVIEQINGENLRTYIERHGPRGQNIAIDWAAQICQFMLYLHGQNPPILHRDLSPDNIMLDENGNIKIVDFGAAHQFMEGITGTLIGKQCYIAPEQLRGKATVQSDIYSFGCTLYFLLTGEDPKALSQSDLAQTNTHISSEIQNLVKSCTAFDETERLKSFQDIASALNAIVNAKHINEKPGSPLLPLDINKIRIEVPAEVKEISP